MADFKFTLKDASGTNITSPIEQSTAIALDVASDGDITYSTFTTVVAEVDVELADGGPADAPIKLTPSGSDVVCVEEVDRVSGGAVWTVTAVGGNNALTLSMGAPASFGSTYEWDFTSSTSGSGKVGIKLKVKTTRDRG